MNKIVNKTFVVRTISGVVLLAVVLGCVLLSPLSFAALMITICIGANYEFYKISALRGAAPLKCYGISVGAVTVLLNFLAATDVIPKTALVLIIPLLVLPFIIELYRKSENPITNISATLLGIIYTAMPMSLMIWIGIGSYYMPWVILSYIFIVWANDVGAYLVGVAFGRHKLFERISPKKSWEGFFGGLVTAIGFGAYAGYLQGQSLLFWCGLAAIVVVSGVYGDLVESMFKRAANIKDSGAIMPGHGGFLDRFDALILSAPFIFVYFIIFTLR